MFETVKVSPSILSANFLEFGREVEALAADGADWIHVDVMDGHFVPNLTMGVPLVKALRASSPLPLDVHLMISNPLEQLPWYLEHSPDFVTIHYEALGTTDSVAHEAHNIVEMIHEAGSKAGISLKPDTPVEVLTDTIELWDMVLIMSVFPGFSGQSFIEGTEERIAELVDVCHAAHCAPLIQVDGGINDTTAARVAAVGADVLVAGNAVLKASHYAQAIAGIRCAAERVQVAH